MAQQRTDAEQRLYVEGQVAGLRLIVLDLIKEIDPAELEKAMKIRRTALIGLCTAVLFTAGPAEAQLLSEFDLYGVEEGRRQRQADLDRYEQRQRQILDDALAPWTPDPWVAEQRRRDAMRQHSIDACNFIDRNAAARSACLEAIR